MGLLFFAPPCIIRIYMCIGMMYAAFIFTLNSHHYLPLLTITYHRLPPLTTTYHRLPPLTTTYHHLPPLTTTYHHLLPLTTAYHHLLYHHLPPLTTAGVVCQSPAPCWQSLTCHLSRASFLHQAIMCSIFAR